MRRSSRRRTRTTRSASAPPGRSGWWAATVPRSCCSGRPRSRPSTIREQGRPDSPTRSTGGYVNLHEGPARLIAERALFVARKNLSCGSAGPRPTSLTPSAAAVPERLLLPPLDVAGRSTLCERAMDGCGEIAGADPGQPRSRTRSHPLASLADWVLFAVAEDGSAQAVQCEPFLASRSAVGGRPRRSTTTGLCGRTQALFTSRFADASSQPLLRSGPHPRPVRRSGRTSSHRAFGATSSMAGTSADGWNPVHEFFDGAWRFTWSDALRRRGHALGRRNYHSIGAPFLYLLDLEPGRRRTGGGARRDAVVPLPRLGRRQDRRATTSA